MREDDGGRPTKRLSLMRTFLLSVVIGALAFGGIAPTAEAAYDYGIGNTQEPNVTVHHQAKRTNTYSQNLVAWRPLSNNCGQAMILGVRNSSGTQIARNENYRAYNTWHTLRKPDGSSVLQYGSFYLNSNMRLYDGSGWYEGTCKWKADLMFNVKNAP